MMVWIPFLAFISSLYSYCMLQRAKDVLSVVIIKKTFEEISRFKLELCLLAQQINAQIIHLRNYRFKPTSHAGLNQDPLKLTGVLLWMSTTGAVSPSADKKFSRETRLMQLIMYRYFRSSCSCILFIGTCSPPYYLNTLVLAFIS